MTSNAKFQARHRVEALIKALEAATKNDAEQEVQGIALSTLEATLDEIKSAVPNDPVAQSVASAYLHEIETGGPVRCVDALLVAHQLGAAVGVGASAYEDHDLMVLDY